MRSFVLCLAAFALLTLSAPAFAGGGSHDSLAEEHGKEAAKAEHGADKHAKKARAKKPASPALVGGVAFLLLVVVGGGAGALGALRENI